MGTTTNQKSTFLKNWGHHFLQPCIASEPYLAAQGDPMYLLKMELKSKSVFQGFVLKNVPNYFKIHRRCNTCLPRNCAKIQIWTHLDTMPRKALQNDPKLTKDM